MLTKAKSAIGSLTAVAMLTASTIVAVPAAQAASPSVYNGAPIVEVGHKGDWRWKKKRRHHRRGGSDFGPVLFGFAAGAILGSVLAQPPRRHYYGSDIHAYCASKYKTYKPWTRTYTGFDGREHYCRYP